jgi:hypothetical protein
LDGVCDCHFCPGFGNRFQRCRGGCVGLDFFALAVVRKVDFSEIQGSGVGIFT